MADNVATFLTLSKNKNPKAKFCGSMLKFEAEIWAAATKASV